LILGGAIYSAGAVLCARGAKKRFRHSVFHISCLLGSFFHFRAVYRYLTQEIGMDLYFPIRKKAAALRT